MVVSGSKTTIAGALVTVLVFSRLKVGTLIVAAVTIAVASWLVLNSSIWDRWAFFFDIYSDKGVLSALTSGRFSRPLDLFENWSEVPWTGLGIFAVGWGYIESDPLDLVMNFGVFGALLFAVFASALFRSRGASWVPWLLVIGASILAGHVVYSVFAAPILMAALEAAGRSADRMSEAVDDVDTRGFDDPTGPVTTT
jgi:hypothetical protein